MLTRHPKLVATARGVNPSGAKSLANDVVSWVRGLSSATTHSVRTQDNCTPRLLRLASEEHRFLVHMSTTPYEQNVSRTVRGRGCEKRRRRVGEEGCWRGWVCEESDGGWRGGLERKGVGEEDE